jgi:predicted Zn-dependent peptidase
METIAYQRLEETLFYEELSNGLKVYLLPKPGFQKTYATFSTNYGSIDNRFKIGSGDLQRVPDGIAHFLEHKMFEEPEGDVFAKFASHGASANAFTSFDRTVYLFSATEHIQENIVTLLDFVQRPYFTDENVEKEKGIIEQEIKMYGDNPDWRVYFGLIEALYQKHPVHIDIAGTVESIYKISKETLYDCYHTFYHPSNMMLFVVGGIDAEATMELIKKNQAAKTFAADNEIYRDFDQEPAPVRTAQKITELPVSLPKCMFGFKEEDADVTGKELLKRECETKLLLDLLFGGSTDLYQKLYDENLISDNFGHDYTCHKGYGFSVIGGDTRDPDLLLSRIEEELQPVLAGGVDPEHFERGKRKKIGSFLRMLNSPEAIANEFTKYRFRDSDLFDILPIYEAMSVNDVNRRLKEHLRWSQLAVSIVKSPSE